MSIHTVTKHIRYEGSSVVAAFHSLSDAEAFIATQPTSSEWGDELYYELTTLEVS